MRDVGTSDAQAFALAHEGATLLDRYRENLDFSLLELAEEHLRAAIGRDPAFAFALLTHGVALEYLGDHDGAIQRFTGLRERHPGYRPEDVIYNLATSYLCRYEESSYRQAENFFLQLTREPASAEMRMLAHASLAMLYAQELADRVKIEPDVGRNEELIRQHFGSAESLGRKLDPRDWRIQEALWLMHNARGVGHLYGGLRAFKRGATLSEAEAQVARAESELEISLRHSPRNPDVLSNIGTMWFFRWKMRPTFEAELLNRSRDIWLEVIRIRPKISFGYYRLGQVELRLGNFDRAVQVFNTALGMFAEVPRDKILQELRMAESRNAADPDARFGR